MSVRNKRSEYIYAYCDLVRNPRYITVGSKKKARTRDLKDTECKPK
jgi:hypothetical protein